MRRPGVVRSAFLAALLVVAAAEAAALLWVGPQYLMRTIRYVLGGDVSVRGVRLAFPLKTALLDVRSLNNTERSAITIQRIVIAPRWLSIPTRTLWLDTVDIERPIIRVSRTRDGTAVWPMVPRGAGAGEPPETAPPLRAGPFVRTIRIDSLRIVDGVFEFIDERHEQTFHALVDHVSLHLGPLTIPVDGLHTSFALHAKLTGSSGDAAPVYCSGWFDTQRRDLQASCQLEPLPLMIFEPYFRGKPIIRPYAVTAQSSSHWLARENRLEAKVHVELNNLEEGDLSIGGRTIIDVKRMTRGREPRLRGEFGVRGDLDRPSGWQVDFRAGDAPMQELVERFEEQRITKLSVPLFGRRVNIDLAAGGPEIGDDMEMAGKEIREALELLAEEPPPAPDAITAPAESVPPETGTPSEPPEPPVRSPAQAGDTPEAAQDTAPDGLP